MALKVNVSHEFPVSVERYIEIFFDPQYVEYLEQNAGVEQYRIESLQRSETHIARTVKVVPKVELPGWMKKALRSKRIAYLETMSHELGSSKLKQTILSSVLPERIQINAVIELEPKGTDRCVRHCEVDISVKILGFGSRIEEQLVGTFKKGFADGVAHMAAFDERAG